MRFGPDLDLFPATPMLAGAEIELVAHHARERALARALAATDGRATTSA